MSLGIKAEKARDKAKLSEHDKMSLGMDTIYFIKAIIKKLQEKSPLQNAMITSCECLVPNKIAQGLGKYFLVRMLELDLFLNLKA